tara:strand:+ start:93 stop:308 length:216 start_codon:yes stop_codon:yes gene_type:complete
VKNNQLDFTKKLSKNPYVRTIITDKLNKPASYILTENELRKLSDKEIDEYSSKIIKELLQSFMQDGEFEKY